MTDGPERARAALRLDCTNERLWRGAEAVPLTPKAFAVLRYLMDHGGRLVTKTELLEAVWPDTHVTDAVLKVYVGEIRKALGDRAAAPRFIETRHRRGYRFIGRLESRPEPGAGERASGAHPLVGRDAALCRLRAALERASAGVRAIVFLTGEPGIGKTTLLDALLGEASARPGLRAARGQCVEHFGAGEPYGPVLEALGRLCRGPGGNDVVAMLGRQAPTWLAQMPWLLEAEERAAIQHDTMGASAERMLREMTEALEALTAESPLVLVLEDLHWADGATLDLVACIARRPEAARLLVITTYRPVEAILHGGALYAFAHDALLRGHASEHRRALPQQHDRGPLAAPG